MLTNMFKESSPTRTKEYFLPVEYICASFSSCFLESEEQSSDFLIHAMKKIKIIGQKWGCPPFEVLNVNMEKDPIQTSEDLFAQIFEVAEKWYIAAASKRPQVIFSASP